MPGVHESQKRAFDPPETSIMDGCELYVGAGNQTQASFKPNTETLIGEGTIFRRDCLASFNYQLDVI